MTIEIVKTTLNGYNKQFFPNRSDEINRVYENALNNGTILDSCQKLEQPFEKIDILTTEDGYEWYLALHCKKGIVILLPKYTVDKKQRALLDRSAAFYTKSDSDMKYVDDLVDTLIGNLST